MKRLAILLITLVVLGAGGYLFYHEGTLPVNSKDNTSEVFIIQPGESLTSIIDKLAQEKLIRSKVVFYLLVKGLRIDKKIQAGDFRLSPSMNAKNLAEELTHGTLDKWLTIYGGLRKEEVAEIIARDFDIPTVEFIQLAQEGYLYPDTYLIPSQASTDDILKIIQRNFESKVTPEILAKASRLSLNENQLLTLASLVEREARSLESKRQVANILLRRLDQGMPLQLDSTVQYALGYDVKSKTWWRTNVAGFTDMDSPYNTYTNTGLPPGPICNPGIDSIEAVAGGNPNATKYLFFLVGNDNKMHYATTHEEHLKNIAKYLQ